DGAGERLPVDAGTRARAEILDPQLVAATLEPKVLARHSRIGHVDVALRPAPDQQVVGIDVARGARQPPAFDVERPASHGVRTLSGCSRLATSACGLAAEWAVRAREAHAERRGSIR